jgi:hypothetical protein
MCFDLRNYCTITLRRFRKRPCESLTLPAAFRQNGPGSLVAGTAACDRQKASKVSSALLKTGMSINVILRVYQSDSPRSSRAFSGHVSRHWAPHLTFRFNSCARVSASPRRTRRPRRCPSSPSWSVVSPRKPSGSCSLQARYTHTRLSAYV